MRDVYDILGIARTATKDEAHAAYRRLASKYHPDKFTDEAEKKRVEVKFKEAKQAWEDLERGFDAAENAPPAPPVPPTPPKGQGFAGKPAPGYEARRQAPLLPRAYIIDRRTHRYGVKIEITERQAFEGCVVPFWHDGNIFDYMVRPGTTSRVEEMSYPRNPMIGFQHLGTINISVELIVVREAKTTDEPTRDAEMELPLCALGLFTGGHVTVNDHLGEPVSISIPAGYDPSKQIVVPGHGFGTLKRGALIVKIVPVFKLPADLNPNEQRQLQRLNEMARK